MSILLPFDPARPVLHLTATNQWPMTSIGIYGVKPPAPGAHGPSRKKLGTLKPSSGSLCTVAIGDANGLFGFAYLLVATSLPPGSGGACVVEVRRDEDPVDPITNRRPVAASLDLSAAPGTSSYIQDFFVLQEVSP